MKKMKSPYLDNEYIIRSNNMAFDPITGRRKPNKPIGQPGVKSGDLKMGSPRPKGSSFNDAFKKARAKGEGTKFTHNGKSYTAVTKDDMKNKGHSSLASYNKAGGAKKVDSTKAAKKITGEVKKNKRPVINAIKKVLLGKDRKFGGDRGLIDFLGKRKKKNPGEGIISKPDKKADGGMMKYKDGGSVSPKRSSKKGVGAAVRGFGKALR